MRFMILFFFLTLVSFVIAQHDSINYKFTYYNPAAKKVSVAGSFNGWNGMKDYMENSQNGYWQLKMKLLPGYYYYKLVVDDEKWIPDPECKENINDGGDSFNSIIKVGNPAVPERKKSVTAFPRYLLPEPILEENPEYIDLYYKAWELAWQKITAGNSGNGFVDFYMDEGFNECIYQWDTSFMAVFAMYASDIFPAMQSLDNFYLKQCEDGYIQRVYNESDGKETGFRSKDEPMTNPPLFAPIELRYYMLTGDSTRIRRVLPVLDKYYIWLEDNCRMPEGKGLYYQTPLGSGMDNTPRNGVKFGGYIDMSAQQALAARSISKLYEIIGDKEKSSEFAEKYLDIFSTINLLCWDENTKYYYDLRDDGTLSPVKHIGAFWTILAGVAYPERKQHLINHIKNPNEFYRYHLVPTLSADDINYNPRGHYWKGGVWAPTNYMVVWGLDEFGFGEVSREIAKNHIENMCNVFKEFEPDENKIAYDERFEDGYKTIWECYSPEKPEPATRWDDHFYSRQDFVGWSGLGPIAMLIENILGVRIYGYENKVVWNITRNDLHGIKNISLGSSKISVVFDPASNLISTESEKPFTLIVKKDSRSYTFDVGIGVNEYTLE